MVEVHLVSLRLNASPFNGGIVIGFQIAANESCKCKIVHVCLYTDSCDTLDPAQRTRRYSGRLEARKACYLGIQTLQVGTDVLDAGSKRVDVQEGRNDP